MDIQQVVVKLNANIIWHTQLDSTNQQAKVFIENELWQEGDVIAAHHQTAGKGQLGNTWQSMPQKNMLCSLLLKPHFLKASDQIFLNMAVCLSLVDLLAQHHIKSVIKWPNDIYVGNQKIAGVLIENQLQGIHIKSCVVGVGLNVNQLHFEGLLNAVSMVMLTHKEIDLPIIISSWISNLNVWYAQLQFGKYDGISQAYHKYLKDLNQEVNFVDENGTFIGIIRKVNVSGQLVVETKAGIKSYHPKQIKWHENN